MDSGCRRHGQAGLRIAVRVRKSRISRAGTDFTAAMTVSAGAWMRRVWCSLN